MKSKARTATIKAAKIAEDLGNVKAMNVALFGALVKAMGLTDIDWEAQISKLVKPKTVEVNLKAFRAGLAGL